MTTKHVDHVTGVETTGHEWDGIRELNKPLPRWWVWTFYATIIWSIGYWVAYPAWPTLVGYTKGVLGYSQRATVTEEVATARAAQGSRREALASTPLDQIKANPDLLRFAMAGGGAAFGTNCAPCHGRSAQGFVGYPNLNDDDWLWGGKIDEIYKTIQYGVRSGHKQAQDSQMPKYGIDKLLDDKQIDDTAEYVLSLTGKATNTAAAERGKKIFAEQCVSCHAEDGKGKADLGAPNLTDAIWLYGGEKPAIVESIRTGRGGVMPAWQGRLDAVTLKALAVYVHSLGGGR
ncbi:MAG: cytochrome-c oxidase, cbb3-type subunit III [Hyphomicrobiaceae bacterium]|nr:MAG: cytochrome-c oxidase, cbb3-type subunit III [Hyphomicrobiaceae bacterium]